MYPIAVLLNRSKGVQPAYLEPQLPRDERMISSRMTVSGSGKGVQIPEGWGGPALRRPAVQVARRPECTGSGPGGAQVIKDMVGLVLCSTDAEANNLGIFLEHALNLMARWRVRPRSAAAGHWRRAPRPGRPPLACAPALRCGGSSRAAALGLQPPKGCSGRLCRASSAVRHVLASIDLAHVQSWPTSMTS